MAEIAVSAAIGIVADRVVPSIASAAREALLDYATTSVEHPVLRRALVWMLSDDKKKMLLTLLEADGRQARFNLEQALALCRNGGSSSSSTRGDKLISEYLFAAEQAAVRALAFAKTKSKITIHLEAVELLVECSCLVATHEQLGSAEVQRRAGLYSSLCEEAMFEHHGKKNMENTTRWCTRVEKAKQDFETAQGMKTWAEKLLREDESRLEECEAKTSLYKLVINDTLSPFGKGFMCLFVVTIPFIAATAADKEAKETAEKWGSAKCGIEFCKKDLKRYAEKMSDLKDDMRTKPEEFSWYSSDKVYAEITQQREQITQTQASLYRRFLP